MAFTRAASSRRGPGNYSRKLTPMRSSSSSAKPSRAVAKRLSRIGGWILVDRFDEDRSVFETYGDVDPNFEHHHPQQIRALHDIHMLPDLPTHFHAFILARAPLRMVFDAVLADAWRQRRFTGAEFVPLQPPTPEERKGRG